MISENKIQKIKIIIFFCGLWTMVYGLCGCDAFVRKFTRKTKKENLPQEQLVLVPQEYKSQLTPEQLYRQYFLFWKSWHDELTESLLQNKSNKKQVDCAEQALKNLMYLRSLLREDTQKKLDIYAKQLTELRDSLIEDTYSTNAAMYRQDAERMKMRILRDFSYNKVKNSLR